MARPIVHFLAGLTIGGLAVHQFTRNAIINAKIDAQTRVDSIYYLSTKIQANYKETIVRKDSLIREANNYINNKKEIIKDHDQFEKMFLGYTLEDFLKKYKPNEQKPVYLPK